MEEVTLGEENVMEITKNKEEIAVKILFCFYLLYLLFQYSYVDMYFDDYGYATLTYGWTGNTHGRNFNLLDLIRFLVWHYLNHGGRVLAFFFEISIFRIGGLAFMQIIQAIVVFLITWLTYCLLHKESGRSKVLLALLCITVYGTVSIYVLRDAVYWYSASVYYLWSFLPFLAALVLKKDLMSKRRKMLVAVFCFTAAFSQEQMAILFVSYFVLTAALERKISGKWEQYSKIAVTFSCLGALFEVMAPGNFVRASATQDKLTVSFFERISHNLWDLHLHIGGTENVIFILLISATAFSALFQMYRYKKLTFFICCIFYVLLATLYCNEYLHPIYIILTVICLIMVLFIFFIYLKRQKKYFLICLLVSGVISQIPMLLVDYRPYRTQFMFEMAFRLVCIYIISEIIYEKNFFTWMIGIGISILGVVNMFSVLKGYQQNDIINQVNRGKLLEASAQLQNGKKISSVVLYKLKNDLYAGDMPYQANDFMIYWIKKYYSLPQTTDIIWTSFGDMINSMIYCVSGEWYEDGWMGRTAVIGYSLDENQSCLEIQVMAPEVFSGSKIFVKHEGKVNEYILQAGENVFYLKPEKREGEFEIYSESTFSPSNGDPRELSVQLSIIPLQNEEE